MKQKAMLELIEKACENCIQAINMEDFSKEFGNKEQFISVFANTDIGTAKTVSYNLTCEMEYEIEMRMEDYKRQKQNRDLS